MDEDGFICPYPWKWNEIHARLQHAWQARCMELKAQQPPAPEPTAAPEPVVETKAVASDSDFDLDFGDDAETERAWDAPAIHIDEDLPPIPEPPHLLAATSTDPMRYQRWRETVEWAAEFGFSESIGTIAESDKYFAV